MLRKSKIMSSLTVLRNDVLGLFICTQQTQRAILLADISCTDMATAHFQPARLAVVHRRNVAKAVTAMAVRKGGRGIASEPGPLKTVVRDYRITVSFD